MKDRFMSDMLICPACGSDTVATRNESADFVFRSGGVEYPVHATYPVHICERCHESFIGEDAEVARHEATCIAMNRLTPADILSLREGLCLSRKAFAQLSGIGEASLARWETGELIQSESNDNLLRLLQWPENIRLLKKIRTSEVDSEPPATHVIARAQVSSRVVAAVTRHYSGLDAEEVQIKRQESKRFRPTGT
jgi:putative zinc finger/helix-turn-helix YgiT family protein